MYVNDYLQFISYLIDEGNADDAEDTFQQTLRDAKTKRR